ncbi:MAG: MarR family transcriptional regulator [Sulfurospirillaceae bacterium]|nr:MarR family transcriptional regulator [Sulfurospirillaceae bacterium]
MNRKFEFILGLSSTYTKIFKMMDRCLSVHGISFSEYLVMYELSKMTNKSIRRIDLAENTGMSASGITRLLNPMEKLNIVEKEQNARDARVSLVKLTDAGFELFTNATQSVFQSTDIFLEALDEKDIELFLNIINKIR